MKALPVVVCSALAGALVVVACGDDSPSADAATCDCPAAEPPITPARIHRVDGMNTVAPNTADGVGVACPAGETLLSGGCYIGVDNSAGHMVMLESRPNPVMASEVATSWLCRWRNDNGSGSAEIHAQALCLRPAQ